MLGFGRRPFIKLNNFLIMTMRERAVLHITWRSNVGRAIVTRPTEPEELLLGPELTFATTKFNNPAPTRFLREKPLMALIKTGYSLILLIFRVLVGRHFGRKKIEPEGSTFMRGHYSCGIYY